MDKKYYNSISKDILDRLKFLNEGNYVDFFRESPYFIQSMYLTYFALAEDIMIETDTENTNINTRYKKHINDSWLNAITSNDIPINFRKKEPSGISNEWLIATIRNSIIHNGIEVDSINKNITLKNNGFLNLLDCTMPIEWFKRFIQTDIGKNIELDNYKYHMFIPPFKTKNVKQIRTDDEIKEYIEKEMHSIVINIKYDDQSNNSKIERHEFITFVESVSAKFFDLYYSVHTSSKDEEFELLKLKKEVELVTEKTTLSNEEYNKILYFNMFKEYFTNKFNIIYPNYKLSIETFKNDNNYIDSLFKRPRMKYRFFKENGHFQGMELSHRLNDKFNHDKITNLSKIHTLYSLYEFGSKYVTTDFNTDKFMRKVVNKKHNINHLKIEKDYAENIKRELEKMGVSLTYEDYITESIIYHMNNSIEPIDNIYKRCKELTDNYNGDINRQDYKNYIKENLKKEYFWHYEEMSNRLSKLNIYPDQVQKEIIAHNLYALNNAKGVFIQNRFDMIEALLYILGVNIYVMNKETHFKDLTDEEYKFMDNINIEGYTKKYYENYLKNIKNDRKAAYNSSKKLPLIIKGIDIKITKDPTNQHYINEKNQ